MGCAMFRVGTRSSMKQASNFVYVGNITLRGPLGCHKNATHKEQLQLPALSSLLEKAFVTRCRGRLGADISEVAKAQKLMQLLERKSFNT